MALIKCNECGKEISDTAEKCPHCGIVIVGTVTGTVQPEKKKSFVPIIIIGLILLGVILGIFVISPLFNSVSKELNTVTLYDKESVNLASNQHQALTFEMKSPATLNIKVTEIYGQNIDFKVLQDGKSIYYSGIKAGGKEVEIGVNPGTISLVVMNDNMIDGKRALVTVIAHRK